MKGKALRREVTSLYSMLVGTFGAAREDLPAMIRLAERQSSRLGHLLQGGHIWHEDLVDSLLSVIVLLDHVGLGKAATQLMIQCRGTAQDDPAVEAKFTSIEWLLHARRGGLPDLRTATSSLRGEVGARLRANVALSDRYARYQLIGADVSEFLRAPTLPGGSIAYFALTSLAFDHAVFAARLSAARVALGRLERLANAIMNELGESHPYLGLVLLTLSSAKCCLAAIDGNIQDLRRYADVLSIAVQRASAQLGPEHIQTIGGMANLAHVEFEIALASRPPREVTECFDNLVWLHRYSRRVCGEDHPTVVILAMNAAVAGLECGRQERSIERIEEAERSLREAFRLAERRFGPSHPCTAIAYSNAASAGFDLARARRSRPELEHMVDVLEDAVSQVSSSLGAGHATARALTRQLRACHRLLASDDPLTSGSGGGTATIVRTVEDELWSLDDDYVPIYEAARPPASSTPLRDFLYPGAPGIQDTYVVLPRALIEAMPPPWQNALLQIVSEFQQAYGHLSWPEYQVQPKRRERLINLDEDQLAEAGYLVEIDADGEIVYRERHGRAIADPESTEVLVPVFDAIPIEQRDAVEETPPRGFPAPPTKYGQRQGPTG